MKKPAPIESLSEAQARREHARLGEEIAAHDRRYYTDDEPTIPDAAMVPIPWTRILQIICALSVVHFPFVHGVNHHRCFPIARTDN